MHERLHPETFQSFNEAQQFNIRTRVLDAAADPVRESWALLAKAQWSEVVQFVDHSIAMITALEGASRPHPTIHSDTDVVYVDSGPGLYSYAKNLLPDGITELGDDSYHHRRYTRKMDRARLRAAHTLVREITARRMTDATGHPKPVNEVSEQDLAQFGPYLQYTSTTWQNEPTLQVMQKLRSQGLFQIPESKIIMYDAYTDSEGRQKPIVHTEDQIQGLQFVNDQGQTFEPRRVAMVSHPAHILRILHILGKYPTVIPENTTLQMFPIPTPSDGLTQYAQDEILGTLATILKKDRASFSPYFNFEV